MKKTHHNKKHHHKEEKDPKTEDEGDAEGVEDIETAEDPSDNIETPPSDPDLYPTIYGVRATGEKKEPLSSKFKHKKKKLTIGIAGLILILIIIIIALTAKGSSDTIQAGDNPGDSSAYVGVSHSPVDRNDYEANLVSAMKGQPSMFYGLGGDTPHVQALNWLKKDRAAQGFAENWELDLLLEQYVLALTVFMSTPQGWFDDYLPQHESWCGHMGIHCTDGRVTMIYIDDDLDELEVKLKLPTEIGFLTELKRLRVGWHGLIGTIPTEVGELTKLLSLEVWDASFTGTIPSEIGHCHDLELLSLSNMPFTTGTIPVEMFSRLDELTNLGIRNMKLSGTIPTQIRFPLLRLLSLEDLELSGSIPSEFAQMTMLRQLKLSGCGLTGTIPSEIGFLNLQELYLDNNAFTGEIPKLFQTEESCKYTLYDTTFHWDYCNCDVSHNSFSNVNNAIAVGCKV